MRMAKLTFVTVFLLMVAAQSGAQEMMHEELGLSDEQETQLRALNHEWAKKEIEISSAIKLAELEFHHAMRDYDTPPKDIVNLAKNLAAAKANVITAHAEHHNKKRAVFTKDQWEKMHAMGHGRESYMKKQHGKCGMKMKKHGEHEMKMKGREQ